MTRRNWIVVAIAGAFPSLLPAQNWNVTGKWVFHVETDAGSGDPEFTLQQNGAALTGKYKGMLGEAEVKGKVEGSNITIEFTVSMGGGATIVYKGTIESATAMKGTVDLAGQASGTWTGKKAE